MRQATSFLAGNSRDRRETWFIGHTTTDNDVELFGVPGGSHRRAALRNSNGCLDGA